MTCSFSCPSALHMVISYNETGYYNYICILSFKISSYSTCFMSTARVRIVIADLSGHIAGPPGMSCLSIVRNSKAIIHSRVS